MGLVKYLGGFSGDGGPATETLLNDPENIAVDTAGNVYISDVLNYRNRRIDANTGIISTIAGTGIKGFSGDGGPALRAQISTPSGIAIDGAGQIYFGDQANHPIRVLVPYSDVHNLRRARVKNRHRRLFWLRAAGFRDES